MHEKKYLDFAAYIVDCGGAREFNIFEAAYQNELYPYEYPVVKAYELMSCFEGLLEYSLVVKEEKWQIAVKNFVAEASGIRENGSGRSCIAKTIA